MRDTVASIWGFVMQRCRVYQYKPEGQKHQPMGNNFASHTHTLQSKLVLVYYAD